MSYLLEPRIISQTSNGDDYEVEAAMPPAARLREADEEYIQALIDKAQG
jgi:hypothetical protein